MAARDGDHVDCARSGVCGQLCLLQSGSQASRGWWAGGAACSNRTDAREGVIRIAGGRR